MTTLFCFGLGYCARRYVADYGAAYDRVIGTSRRAEAARAAAAIAGPRVDVLAFDGVPASALTAADRLLVSIPPSATGDPVLAAFADTLAGAARLQAVAYLSTIGVYGDHAGAEVDETTAPRPISARSRARLAAERAWRDLGTRAGKPVAILRLAGLYGPGRNVLRKLAEGRAAPIVKDGHVFNRIHVADVAQAIDAAFARRADGIFNVADDEPSAAEEVITYGASLLGIAPPPPVPFAQASLSPMAQSFYAESKRAGNDRLKRELGVRLIYPTYRHGLDALHAAGEGSMASIEPDRGGVALNRGRNAES